MKKEITGIACTVIIILISMWFMKGKGKNEKRASAGEANARKMNAKRPKLRFFRPSNVTRHYKKNLIRKQAKRRLKESNREF